MGVHSLQVELSEHHYCHEFLLKYFISHRKTDGDTNGEEVGGVSVSIKNRLTEQRCRNRLPVAVFIPVHHMYTK